MNKQRTIDRVRYFKYSSHGFFKIFYPIKNARRGVIFLHVFYIFFDIWAHVDVSVIGD